jgi:small GTP-binding protein
MWQGRTADKELHPSVHVQRAVKFSNSVQVREFAEEQHPRAFFKIRHSFLPPSLCFTPSPTPTSPPPWLTSHLTTTYPSGCIHHSIQIGSDSGDTSTTCTEDSWDKEDDISQDLKRLTVTEDEYEDEISQDDIFSEDINFYESDNDELNKTEELEVHSKYRDGACELKDDETRLESFKINWSFKRKKKKKLRLKTPQRPRKILLLGDMNCGKSALITTYCKDRFTEQYNPTILHCCKSDAKVLGRNFDLILTDTPGRQDYKPLRRCTYVKTDVAILCYSAGDPNSFDNIHKYWLPELDEYAPNCPFVIAETKKDVRDEYEDKQLLLESVGKTESVEYKEVCRQMEGVVPEGKGMQLARELGAERFYSTSARYRVGTRGLFQGATKVAIRKTRRRRRI